VSRKINIYSSVIFKGTIKIFDENEKHRFRHKFQKTFSAGCVWEEKMAYLPVPEQFDMFKLLEFSALVGKF